MSASVLCATLFLTLAYDAGAENDLGHAEYVISPGSRWRAVKGMKGDCPIESASVTFDHKKQEVTVAWRVKRPGGGSFSSTTRYRYQIDQASHLPEFQFLGKSGKFRFVGNTLELEVSGFNAFESLHEPPGNLLLVLKPAK